MKRKRRVPEIETVRKAFAAFCRKNGMKPPQKWHKRSIGKEKK